MYILDQPNFQQVHTEVLFCSPCQNFTFEKHSLFTIFFSVSQNGAKLTKNETYSKSIPPFQLTIILFSMSKIIHGRWSPTPYPRPASGPTKAAEVLTPTSCPGLPSLTLTSCPLRLKLDWGGRESLSASALCLLLWERILDGVCGWAPPPVNDLGKRCLALCN